MGWKGTSRSKWEGIVDGENRLYMDYPPTQPVEEGFPQGWLGIEIVGWI